MLHFDSPTTDDLVFTGIRNGLFEGMHFFRLRVLARDYMGVVIASLWRGYSTLPRAPSPKPQLFLHSSVTTSAISTAHIRTMPPRSVADATRFTPTGPHAFTRSAAPGSAAGEETPQERVARLREAARRAKVEKAAGSTFDRLVDRGRVWADRAHRATAVGLIGATILCGGVTIYAFTDMIIYNRRRKAEYSEQLKLQRAQLDSVAAPREAEEVPTVAVPSEPQARQEIKGPWEKLKGWAMSGMTPAGQEYKTRFEKEEVERRKAAGVRDATRIES